MKQQTPKKLEIFLLLALRQAAKSLLPGEKSGASAGNIEADKEEIVKEEEAAAESEALEETAEQQQQQQRRLSAEIEEQARAEALENIFAVFSAQLSAPGAEKFERLRLEYENKSEAEREKWRARVKASVGRDEPTIDESVHWSHVEAALEKETALVRKIVAPAVLSAQHKDRLKTSPAKTNDNRRQTSEPNASDDADTAKAQFEKVVRRAFAAQFVAARDLPIAGTFDRLSGANLARLARLAGIREAAFACAGIESVETVGAFLRRFAPEHARAIAAQLSALPKTSDERLRFAENLVRAALEAEPNQPSAMLDWLGLRLIGILLCAQKPERIAYTEQKLPLVAAPRLSEIIAVQCRETPAEMRREIGTEIERLAGTIAGADVKNK